MSQNPEGTQLQQRVPAEVAFRNQVERFSNDFITTMVGPEEAPKLQGRFALAFRSAAIRNPDLYEVPPIDVAWAVARSAMTGLMPGGPAPHVHLIVRRDRKLNRKALVWQVASRGWQKMAEDAGYIIDAIPVCEGDHFVFEVDASAPGGRRVEHSAGNPFRPATWEDLLGYICIARHKTSRRDPIYRLVDKNTLEKLRSKADTQRVWNEWSMEMAEKAAKAYVIRRGMVPMTSLTERLVQLDSMMEPPSLASNPGGLQLVQDDEAPAEAAPPPEPRAGMDGVSDVLHDVQARNAAREAQESAAEISSGAAETSQPEQKPEPAPAPPPAKKPKSRKPASGFDGMSPEEVEHEMDSIRAVVAQLPEGVKLGMMHALNDGKKIRIRHPNATVWEFGKRARAWLAEQSAKELPPEPEPDVVDAEELDETEPFGVEEVEEMVTSISSPTIRGMFLSSLGIPESEAPDAFGKPDWAYFDDKPELLQKYGAQVEAYLQEQEAGG